MAKKTSEKDAVVKNNTNTKSKAAAKKETVKKTTPKVTAKKETAKKTISKVTAKKENSVKKSSKAKANQEIVDEIKLKSGNSSKKEENSFLDDFNWHNYEEGIDVIDEKQLAEFEKLVKDNFVDTSDEDVIQGTVVYMTDREAIIDINAKSEGVISLNEFRYNPDLKVGDKVEVIVDTREDRTGQLVLSHRKARIIKAWD